MSDPVEDRARQAALADWQSHTARWLTIGALMGDRPLLGRQPDDRPFYVASMGCVVTPEDDQFCAAYNATIDRLLKEHGVPAWAPAARRPDRHAVLELLSRDGRPLDELRLERPPYEHRLYERVLNLFRSAPTGRPQMFCRDRDKGLLIFGGDVSAKAGRVDVLDVEQRQWMATYEYLRKHVARLPWDQLEGRAGTAP